MRGIGVLLLFILLSTQLVFGKAYTDEVDLVSSFDAQDLQTTLCGAKAFSTSTETRCKSPTTSIDQFLSLLPESYRQHYVLMFDSGSLQGATYQNPRAILYGETAELLLSFNGHSSQKGYNKLETMAWVESDRRFVFREIEFLSDQPGTVRVSKENPQKCLRCHRQDPRPNWHHYQFWPGAYGQLDDLPTVAKHSFKDPASGQFIEFDNTRAAKELPIFVEAAKTKRRYRHLLNMKENHLSQRPGGRSGGIPNQVLTVKLYEKNFKRVARILRGLPQYKILRWPLIGAFKCDPFTPYENQENSVVDFFPEDVKRWRSDVPYQPDSVAGTRVQYNMMKYLFSMLGMEDFPFEDLFTNTQPGPGNSFESATTQGGIQILYELAKEDPELASYLILHEKPFRRTLVGYATLDWIRGYDCYGVKKLSLTEFAKLKREDENLYCEWLDLPCRQQPAQQLPSLQPPHKLLKTCIGCHDDYFEFNNVGPAIPFSKPARFKRALREVDSSGENLYERILWRISEEAPAKKRMPKNNRHLSGEQRHELKSYLDKLLVH